MSITQQDRNAVSTMHSVANGTGSGVSYMSRKRSYDRLDRETPQPLWSSPPTVIPKPGTRPFNYRAPKANPALNPFSMGSWDTLGRSNQKPEPAIPRTNPNARTLVSHNAVPSCSRSPTSRTRLGRQPVSKKQKVDRVIDTESPDVSRDSSAMARELQDKKHRSIVSSSISPVLQAMDITSADNSHSRSSKRAVQTVKSVELAQDEFFISPSHSRRQEVIDVDDDEDLGVLVSTPIDPVPPTASASSDDLQLISPSRSHRNPRAVTENSIVGHILGVSGPHKQHAFDEGLPEYRDLPPPSGPQTSALKARLDYYNEDEIFEDPIQDADDFEDKPFRPPSPRPAPQKRKSTPSGTTEFPVNNVRRRISQFEIRSKRPEPPPMVDLVAKAKTSRVGAMKRKNQKLESSLGSNYKNLNLDRPPPASQTRMQSDLEFTPTRFRRQNRSRQSDKNFPLDAWACDSRVIESISLDEPYPRFWLRIRDEKFISIVNAPVEKGDTLFDFVLGEDICAVELPTKDIDLKAFPLVIFSLRPTERTDRFFKRERFKEQSKHAIAVKLLTSHPNWSTANFDAAVTIFKTLVGACHLDAAGLRGRWQTFQPTEDMLASIQSTTSTLPQTTKRKPQPRPTYTGTAQPSISSDQSTSSVASTRRIPRQTDRPPSPPADEIILLYPPTGTGAVNVTNGDLKRLEPGEYLNDTLIEFGLKLWLHDLRSQRPEFADQVHVFSSFFYTQLNQKNFEEGYQSVRKWTSKFDFFKKKYIIVPINEHLHWYLTIICHPERTLQQPVSIQTTTPSVTTRIQSRESTAMVTTMQSHAPLRGHASTRQRPISKDGAASVQSPVGDEQEVEQAVHVSPDSPGAPILDVTSSPLSTLPDDNSDSTEVTEDGKEGRAVGADVSMEPTPTSPHLNLAKFPSSTIPIPAAAFYATSGSTGMKTRSNSRLTDDDREEGEIDELDDDDSIDVDKPSVVTEPTKPDKPMIFSFDSLGARHPYALKLLSRYLEMEAKDKKGLTNVVQATTKQASVPAQPNYCDCGVYLLHFVEQFMSDPDTFSRHITAPKSKRITQSNKLDRERLWSHDKVAGRREEMKQRIMSLSTEWRREKEADSKGKTKEKVEDEPKKAPTQNVDHDSDIEVLEVGPEPSRAVKTPRSRSLQKAARLR